MPTSRVGNLRNRKAEQMSVRNSVLLRCLGAVAAGACGYAVTLYQFLSYSQRNALPGANYLTMAGLAFGLAFLLVLGLGRSWWRVAFSLLRSCESRGRGDFDTAGMIYLGFVPVMGPGPLLIARNANCFALAAFAHQ
jgi:hypothetical protein